MVALNDSGFMNGNFITIQGGNMSNRMPNSRIAVMLILTLMLTLLLTNAASAATLTINGCTIQPSTQCPGVNLSGAKITSQHLEGANLQGADLSYADLTNTHLTGVNLYGANLTGTNLDRAHLLNADLDATIGLTLPQLHEAYLCNTHTPLGDWTVFADCKHMNTGK